MIDNPVRGIVVEHSGRLSWTRVDLGPNQSAEIRQGSFTKGTVNCLQVQARPSVDQE